MTTSFVILSLCSAGSLLRASKHLLSLGLLIGLVMAMIDGVIFPLGAVILAISALLSYFHFSYKPRSLAFDISTFILLGLVVGCIFFNLCPTFFQRPAAFIGLKVSEQSCAFSMFPSLDKLIAALILFLFMPKNDIVLSFKRCVGVTSLSLLGCIAVLLGPALATGYIQWDLKWPAVLPLWFLNNLLVVSVAEEIFYRGYVQRTLVRMTSSRAYGAILSIGITSLLFGLNHYAGGAIFVVLSALAGLFYGWTYYKTNSLLCAVLVHAGVNLTHLLLFTYPTSVLHCSS